MTVTTPINPRPEYSVGDIFRQYGDMYDKSHPMSPEQCKVLRTLSKCRTAALGGHLYVCDGDCDYEIPVYNSCRDRHCPLCQGIAMKKWLAKRLQELLPVPYYHTIFTISHGFDALLPYNERVFYDTLFEVASYSLDYMARKYYDGIVGTTAILHTWGQRLQRHPHLHCLVTGGALSLDRKRWIPIGDKQLFDVKELAQIFRDRFCERLWCHYRKGRLVFKHKAAYLANEQAFEDLMVQQESMAWNVFCKRPFAGPETVVEYLGRYSHRVAISNRRIQSVANGQVVFTYKDYRDLDAQNKPKEKTEPCSIEEFIRRFLQHVLPKGYQKIRYFGFMAGNKRLENLELCRALIRQHPDLPSEPMEIPVLQTEFEPTVCPHCGAQLVAKNELKPKRAGPYRQHKQRKVA